MPSIIGYARVSSREQAENSHALEQQVARLVAAGAQEVYRDIESGSSSDRASFKQVMHLVREAYVEEVIFTRLDRMTRSLPLLRKTIEEFQKSGVNLRVLDDAIDLHTAAGKFHVNMLGALAEMEVDRLSERVRHGHRHHRDRNAGYFAPFGYRKVGERFELDHQPFLCLLTDRKELSRAAIGRDLIEIYLHHRSLRRSLRTINSKYGIQTHALVGLGKGNRHAKGKFQFSYSGFASWLSNPILRGHLCYGRTSKQRFTHTAHWDVRYDTHPDQRLLSDEEYRPIEEILSWNATHSTWSPKGAVHPLSGLVTCAQCRGRCRIASFSLRTNRQIKKYSYQCGNYHLKSCTSKQSVRESVLEQAIIDALTTRAEMITQLADQPQVQAEPLALKELRSQLQSLEIIPGFQPAIEAAKQELRSQIQSFQLQLSQQHQHSSTNRELLLASTQSQSFWRTLPPTEKRELYRALVERVVIYEGQVQSVVLRV